MVRFAARERHQVFLEPEGPDSPLVYPAGLSTSMPADVQLDFLRTIPGLEQVEVVRYGYAVEYDYAPPTQLKRDAGDEGGGGPLLRRAAQRHLGLRGGGVPGAVRGDSGGAAGARASRRWCSGRDEAHGAVLVDELVTKGVDEPFRMFTSRSEHRLKLREGNADLRLAKHGHRVGLVSARGAGAGGGARPGGGGGGGAAQAHGAGGAAEAARGDVRGAGGGEAGGLAGPVRGRGGGGGGGGEVRGLHRAGGAGGGAGGGGVGRVADPGGLRATGRCEGCAAEAVEKLRAAPAGDGGAGAADPGADPGGASRCCWWR